MASNDDTYSKIQLNLQIYSLIFLSFVFLFIYIYLPHKIGFQLFQFVILQVGCCTWGRIKKLSAKKQYSHGLA